VAAQEPHGHAVEAAHTALGAAVVAVAAPQGLDLADVPMEGPELGHLGHVVDTDRAREPHAEAGLGCDPARVAEGDDLGHYQDEGVEGPELGTDRG
jgi:hypothetical protein